MNINIVLAIVVGLIVVLVGYFALVSPPTIQAAIMFGGVGSAISVCFVMIMKRLYKSMYGASVRIWEERHDQLIITKVIRAKRSNQDTLELSDGTKIKSPDRKFIVYGNDNYIDVIKKGDDYFPMKYDKSTDQLKGTSVNNRRWLAVQIQADNKASEPKVNNMIQIAAMVSLMSVVIIFVMGMALGPDFLTKVNDFWQKQYAELDKRNIEFYNKISESPIQITCTNGMATIEKPTPPPS